MNKKFKLIFLVMILGVSTPSIAKIYKWEDANGKTHYTATPPPNEKKAKLEEVRIQKTPESSLTHIPSTHIADSSDDLEKTIKKTSKKRKKQKSSRAENHCKDMFETISSLSNKDKLEEINNCKAHYKNADNKTMKTAEDAGAALRDLMGKVSMDKSVMDIATEYAKQRAANKK